jgi:hypothetical protein
VCPGSTGACDQPGTPAVRQKPPAAALWSPGSAHRPREGEGHEAALGGAGGGEGILQDAQSARQLITRNDEWRQNADGVFASSNEQQTT